MVSRMKQKRCRGVVSIPDPSNVTDMPTQTLPIPGTRRVEASLDLPEGVESETMGPCVTACPPHPEFGGNRGDRRLRAVSDALQAAGIATCRFDYAEWDQGYGEREDARNTIRWAAERADQVGCFGYSFGGAIATLATATVDVPVEVLSVLAPASHVRDDLAAATALADVDCPVQVVYGERDETADWEPLVEAARRRGDTVVALAADHHFVGQQDLVCETVVPFIDATIGE
jgi:alpha/beta superfamily hydrolase